MGPVIHRWAVVLARACSAGLKRARLLWIPAIAAAAMVHGKYRKLKHNFPKEKMKAVDGIKLNEQLDVLGLKIAHVTADGNCFFRAVADQLEGDEEEHAKYRRLVVDYLQEHREEFEPFVEDEVPFDEYCKSMHEDSTWAGHLELQAASLVTRCNICIHQLLSPRWHIRNFENADTRTLHLSYHDGEHYNSVRRLDDDGQGPARPVSIQADASPATRTPPVKDKVTARHKGRNTDMDDLPIKMVMSGTGCTDVDRVRQVLHEVHGDTDAAMEFLIAEQSTSGEISPACSCESIPSSSEASGSWTCDFEQNHSHRASGSDDSDSVTSHSSCYANGDAGRHSTSSNTSRMFGDMSTLRSRVAARNKACPCGSKRKYKACCGAMGPKSTAALVSSLEEPTARKESLRAAKGDSQTNGLEDSDVSEVFDMGALCI